MIVEKSKNVFTKEYAKNIIRKKYNPLNKDEGFYEREGLFMRETEEVVLDEIIEELNFIERIIVRFFSRTFIKVYNKTRIKIVNAMLK